MKKESSAGESIFGCVFVLLMPFLAALTSIFDGWVAVRLWSWFVAPYADHYKIPAPSLVVWVGLAYIVALLFRSRTPTPTNATTSLTDALGRAIGTMILVPLMMWWCGALIYWWL